MKNLKTAGKVLTLAFIAAQVTTGYAHNPGSVAKKIRDNQAKAASASRQSVYNKRFGKKVAEKVVVEKPVETLDKSGMLSNDKNFINGWTWNSKAVKAVRGFTNNKIDSAWNGTYGIKSGYNVARDGVVSGYNAGSSFASKQLQNAKETEVGQWIANHPYITAGIAITPVVAITGLLIFKKIKNRRRSGKQVRDRFTSNLEPIPLKDDKRLSERQFGRTRKNS